MTDVFGSPEKFERRNRLFQIGVQTLEAAGWAVERIPGAGKSSVRRIRKGGQSRVVSIRTTQDTWLAFPRDKTDSRWVTLSEVDVVVAVSVDDPNNPKFALVHMLEGDDVRDRFDRAYAARRAAGRSLPVGRGVWVALYLRETGSTAHVGGGAGLDSPPIARVRLEPGDLAEEATSEPKEVRRDENDKPLSIPEAKRRLGITFGVDPSNIKITIEG